MGETQSHIYDDKFFDYIEIKGRRSAEVIIELVLRNLHISSVLDVGCGRGAWIDEWRRAGVEDIFGVDGFYVDPNRLAVPAKYVAAFDLSKPLRLNRRFDLVQSLEVAEHISASEADSFVDSLVAHGDIIMFSAAVPGQGGEFHVNEQPYEYWREKFTRRDFVLVDFIRPNIDAARQIEPWYRYNTLLFVHKSVLGNLPATIRSHEIPDQEPVRNFAPPIWRLRNSILRRLPRSLIERLARLKHAAVRAGLPMPS
jgi:SAM-dependent methyltransferase